MGPSSKKTSIKEIQATESKAQSARNHGVHACLENWISRALISNNDHLHLTKAKRAIYYDGGDCDLVAPIFKYFKKYIRFKKYFLVFFL